MNNIDILERLEYFEPDDLVECAMYRECIEGVKTLISENKELKKEKDRVGKLYYEANENCIKYEKDYIPKSKVKEVIEEVKEDENPSISSFQEYAQEYAIDKLQFLLGKE